MTLAAEDIALAIDVLDNLSDAELGLWRRTVKDLVRRCEANPRPAPTPIQPPTQTVTPEDRSFAALLWVLWQAPDLVGRSWRDRRPVD